METNKEKVLALAQLLNIEPEQIKVENDFGGEEYAQYYTPDGTYTVLTEDERMEVAVEWEQNLFDDIGLDFVTVPTQEYFMENFVEDNNDFFREHFENFYIDYFHDIENEAANDDHYEHRCQQELAEAKFSESDLSDYFDALDEIENADDEDESDVELNEDIKKFFDEYEDNADNLIEERASELADEDEEGGFAETFKMHYGADMLRDLFKDGTLTLDIEECTRYIDEVDGLGGVLSSWDGIEHEEGNYYIYKQDDEVYIREEEDGE